MPINQNESAIDFLELINRMKYFTKIKPESNTDNSYVTTLKVSNYGELNHMLSSLLKTSISRLKNNPSEVGSDVMILLEIALQLLPNDEMEFLDEVFNRSTKN